MNFIGGFIFPSTKSLVHSFNTRFYSTSFLVTKLKTSDFAKVFSSNATLTYVCLLVVCKTHFLGLSVKLIYSMIFDAIILASYGELQQVKNMFHTKKKQNND